ncbi:MAG: HTTM domain-containing protein [Planctomycetes bacterium]|nr:HTTM domain-containing protein [Planctomycetota bacterium]
MRTASGPPQHPEARPQPGGAWLSSVPNVSLTVRTWDRFWFRPADPLPLGVIRLFAGAVILYIHLIYSLDLQDLVGREAWQNDRHVSREGRQEAKGPLDYQRNKVKFYPPVYNWEDPGPETEPLAKGMPLWSVWFHVQDPGWVVAVHVCFLIGMFLFTIGFATRVTAVITWVGVITYIHRTLATVFGMDAMMTILAFYLMIAPSGATLSVDRLIARWWARRKGLPEPEGKPLVSANFTLRLMQIHFCFIYMASGLSKLQGPAWWNGNALWGTMANYSFAPMHWPAYLELLRFLSRHRMLWECIMFFGSYFTLFIEISFTFLIWRKSTRWLMIIGAVLLHTGIGLIMGLATFSLCMLCLVLCFVPAETFHRLIDATFGQARSLKGKVLGARHAARKETALAGQA